MKNEILEATLNGLRADIAKARKMLMKMRTGRFTKRVVDCDTALDALYRLERCINSLDEEMGHDAE